MLRIKDFFFRFEKSASEPNDVDSRGTEHRVIDSISGMAFLDYSRKSPLGSLLSSSIFKPFVRHFLSAHIRRQYQKLYSLYLAEFLIQSRNSQEKENLVELKEIATDMKNYSETLPSLKGVSTVFLATLSVIGTVFGILDLNFKIGDILPRDLIAIYVIGFILPLAFIIPSFPLDYAFYYKRFLFKGKKSKDLRPFIFEEKKATTLYNSSVYKLEDKLFELLGGREQKPKEIPIDIILSIIASVFGIVFYFYFVLSLSFDPSLLTALSSLGQSNQTNNQGQSNPSIIQVSIPYLIGLSVLYTFYIVVNVSRYKNRVKGRLV